MYHEHATFSDCSSWFDFVDAVTEGVATSWLQLVTISGVCFLTKGSSKTSTTSTVSTVIAVVSTGSISSVNSHTLLSSLDLSFAALWLVTAGSHDFAEVSDWSHLHFFVGSSELPPGEGGERARRQPMGEPMGEAKIWLTVDSPCFNHWWLRHSCAVIRLLQ